MKSRNFPLTSKTVKMAIELKPTKKGGHYCGRTIVLPHLGNTQIPQNGRMTIEDDSVAHAFIKSLPRDWEYVDPTQNPDYVEGESLEKESGESLKQKSEEDELGQGNGQSIFEDLDDEEKKEFLEGLPNLTRKALEGMCAPFPGGEWRGKNKEQLVEYIKAKLGA